MTSGNKDCLSVPPETQRKGGRGRRGIRDKERGERRGDWGEFVSATRGERKEGERRRGSGERTGKSKGGEMVMREGGGGIRGKQGRGNGDEKRGGGSEKSKGGERKTDHGRGETEVVRQHNIM